jgi:tRNA nucleotidyltransferase/poly(A) polymerase
MDIGTPSEDAFRRDLTINAMFYNLRTCAVEDLTGKGLEHLKSRLIATPLAARVTLLDDPLRLLRAVRFASRSAHVSREIVPAHLSQTR